MAEEVRSECRQTLVLALGPAIFDGHGLTRDVAELAEGLLVGGRHFCKRARCPATEKPDQWLPLLRVRSKRPRRQPAKQRDELAPPHGLSPARIAPYHAVK